MQISLLLLKVIKLLHNINYYVQLQLYYPTKIHTYNMIVVHYIYVTEHEKTRLNFYNLQVNNIWTKFTI